jgi:glucosamine--fructose-6-phosphate aminotransferase (isomerizing)
MNALEREVRDQPSALRRLRDFYLGDGTELRQGLRRLCEQNAPSQVMFSGMGSSLFAAYPAMRLLSERGIPASMIETSELLHYHVTGVPPGALVVLVSQSGETIEVERLLQRLPKRDRLVAITNVAGSTLGRAGAVTLPVEAGPQQVEVSARSYHNMMATMLVAADELSGGTGNILDRLPAVADAMASVLAEPDALGVALDDFVGHPVSTSILARGPSLATAHQAAFNLKEIARFPAEPMSAAQFRHGPIEIASPSHLTVLFAPLGSTFTLLRKLAEELLGYGDRVIFVTDSQESSRHQGDGLLTVRHPHLGETLAPLVNLLPMQLLAATRAARTGIEAGRLAKASAVMRVE